MAASPLGMSAYARPLDGLRYPGNLPATSGVMYPMVASIETRPCLISVERRRLNAAASPSLLRPAGSQKPTGACTPSSLSNARSGDPV
eukprot:5912413-Pyramimonas_sp.AAC.1